MLQREKIVPVEATIDEELQSVLMEAREKLRYSGYDSRLQSGAGRAKAQKKAEEIFAAVGYSPYSKASVDEHKRQVVKQMSRPYWLRNFCNSDLGETVMVVGGIVGVIAGVVTGAVTLAHFANDIPVWHHWMTVGACLSGVGLLNWWGIAAVRSITDRRAFLPEWQTCSINGYNRPIPLHVISRALELKRVYPLAEFQVEFPQVNVTQQQQVFPPDPFLAVLIEGQYYYIDVWDEKDFERKIESKA